MLTEFPYYSSLKYMSILYLQKHFYILPRLTHCFYVALNEIMIPNNSVCDECLRCQQTPSLYIVCYQVLVQNSSEILLLWKT